MYPEIFKIGNFPIHTYGVFLALGMMLGLYAAARLGGNDGLSRDRIYDLGLWTLIGALVGSKLLMFVVDDHVEIFSLDFLRSGGVYYGGFLGGLITVVALSIYYKMPFWKVGDAFAPGVALGQFFGRQGCFSAGCCWGKETSLPWGVHFTEKGHEFTGVPVYGPDGSDLYLHPTQLYESFFMLLVFAFLFYLHKRKKFDGQVLIAYGVIYGIWRFAIEFLRDDPRGSLFGLNGVLGLSTSQIISLLVGLGALAFMIYKLRKGSETT